MSIELVESHFIPAEPVETVPPDTSKYAFAIKDNWLIPNSVLFPNIDSQVALYSQRYALFTNIATMQLGIVLNESTHESVLQKNNNIHIFLKMPSCEVEQGIEAQINISALLLQEKMEYRTRQTFQWTFRKTTIEMERMSPRYPLFSKKLITSDSSIGGIEIEFECVLKLPPDFIGPESEHADRERKVDKELVYLTGDRDTIEDTAAGNVNFEIVLQSAPTKLIKIHKTLLPIEIITCGHKNEMTLPIRFLYQDVLIVLNYVYYRVVPKLEDINEGVMNLASAWGMLHFMDLCRQVIRSPMVDQVTEKYMSDITEIFPPQLGSQTVPAPTRDEGDVERDCMCSAPKFEDLKNLIFCKAVSNVKRSENESQIAKGKLLLRAATRFLDSRSASDPVRPLDMRESDIAEPAPAQDNADAKPSTSRQFPLVKQQEVVIPSPGSSAHIAEPASAQDNADVKPSTSRQFRQFPLVKQQEVIIPSPESPADIVEPAPAPDNADVKPSTSRQFRQFPLIKQQVVVIPSPGSSVASLTPSSSSGSGSTSRGSYSAHSSDRSFQALGDSGQSSLGEASSSSNEPSRSEEVDDGVVLEQE